MSDNLRKCLPVLEFVASIRRKALRTAILKELSKYKAVYKAIKELALNTINKNIPLKKKDKVKLRKSATTLQSFKKKKNNKRTLVIQSGGFLPYLVPLFISLLQNG